MPDFLYQSKRSLPGLEEPPPETAAPKMPPPVRPGGLPTPDDSVTPEGGASSELFSGMVDAAETSASPASDAAPASGAAGHAGGAPLPPELQAPMERSFGADFSGVRVHQGTHVADQGARALTTGTDVHFAPGEYDPASPAGRALLGHELAHVVQQRAGQASSPQPKRRAGEDEEDAPFDDEAGEDPALEAEADQAGDRAAEGRPARVVGASQGVQLKASRDRGLRYKMRGDQQRIFLINSALHQGSFKQLIFAMSGKPLAGDEDMNQRFRRSMEGTPHAGQDLGDVIMERFRDGRPERELMLNSLWLRGRPSPVDEVNTALGKIDGSLATDHRACIEAIVRAPSFLGVFGMTFEGFWNEIQDSIRKTLNGKELAYVESFKDLQLQKDERTAKTRALLDKAEEINDLHGAGHLTEAKKQEFREADAEARDAKADVSGAARTALARLLRLSERGLKKLDPEALGLVHRFVRENPEVRGPRMNWNDSLLEAVDALVAGHPRNGRFVEGIIEGKIDEVRSKLLETRQEDEPESPLASVMPSSVLDAEVADLSEIHALMERENVEGRAQKKDDHGKLKRVLGGMSARSREDYVLTLSGPAARRDYRDLRSDEERHQMVHDEGSPFVASLEAKLVPMCKDAAELAELKAMFLAPASSDKLVELFKAVEEVTTPVKDKPAFGRKVLRAAAKLAPGDYALLRSRQDVIHKIRANTTLEQRQDLEDLIGSLDFVEGPLDQQGERAADEAELNPGHWVARLSQALHKVSRAPMTDKVHDREVWMVGYLATAAARRNARLKDRDIDDARPAPQPDAAFLQVVANTLDAKAASVLATRYAALDTALHDGTGVDADTYLARVAKLHTLEVVHQYDPRWVERAVGGLRGRELLDDWSNAGDLRDKLATTPADQRQQTVAGFVLDVSDERKRWIKAELKPDDAREALSAVRERLAEAAEEDDDFKRVDYDFQDDQGQQQHGVAQLSGASADLLSGLALFDQGDKADTGIQYTKFSSKGRGKDVALAQLSWTMASEQEDIAQGELAEGRSGQFRSDQETARNALGRFNTLRDRVAMVVQTLVAIVLAAAASAATMGIGAGPLIAAAIAFGFSVVGALLKPALAYGLTGASLDRWELVKELIVAALAAGTGIAGQSATIALSQAGTASEWGVRFFEASMKSAFQMVAVAPFEIPEAAADGKDGWLQYILGKAMSLAIAYLSTGVTGAIEDNVKAQNLADFQSKLPAGTEIQEPAGGGFDDLLQTTDFVGQVGLEVKEPGGAWVPYDPTKYGNVPLPTMPGWIEAPSGALETFIQSGYDVTMEERNRWREGRQERAEQAPAMDEASSNEQQARLLNVRARNPEALMRLLQARGLTGQQPNPQQGERPPQAQPTYHVRGWPRH